ncbi:MAG: hypothetical protein KDN22_29760, partial [Verrucomicrobiae bacterium]|nr:hypothetical protein [Verrucomicrobiae bacterium]
IATCVNPASKAMPIARVKANHAHADVAKAAFTTAARRNPGTVKPIVAAAAEPIPCSHGNA